MVDSFVAGGVTTIEIVSNREPTREPNREPFGGGGCGGSIDCGGTGIDWRRAIFITGNGGGGGSACRGDTSVFCCATPP